jgi:putative cell wall-binding protein
VDVPSEEPGTIEFAADQSRATIRPGGSVNVSADITGNLADDEEPVAPGTEIAAQVKVAEGDTDPLFSVTATVAEDGTVSLDVAFPEDTEPGVYLVILVIPGATDANGNVLRRPRVAIATVVVRGRAGGAASAASASPAASGDDGPKVKALVAVTGGAVTPKAEAPALTTRRFAGDDRYGTAQALATEAFGTVLAPILTTGEAFPDALAASYVAGATRAPILLTPSGALDPGITATLQALGATGVEIVGGTSAVSDGVRAQLEAAGYATTRLGGVDRYDTARQIATLIPSEGVGRLEDHGLTAVLVNGDSFADALSAGPMSYSQGWPILLTSSSGLHPMARSAIEELGIEHVIVVGGPAAVGDQVVRDLEDEGVSVERVAGADRRATARAVADFLFDRLSYDANDLLLARSDDFADALAAAPRAGDEIMPVLLTQSADQLGDAAASFIVDHRDVLTDVEIVGGTSAVSEAVRRDAELLARE